MHALTASPAAAAAAVLLLLSAHERVQVGGTKGGITQGAGNYTGHYQGEGSATETKATGDAVKEQE
jgi:hypothetical protein